MTAVTSGEFLNEFTLYADRANDDDETFVIQRENGKHLVMMSLDEYNAIQKKLGVADEDLPVYERKVTVLLLDDKPEEPMTWRKWHEERIRK